jgi:hypothetical protein
VNERENPIGKHELRHNPGYDFLRLLSWLEEADPENPSLPFAAYFLPVLSILAGTCAIEGYVSMVGQRLDSKWASFNTGCKPISMKDRLEKAYKAAQKTVDFESPVWKDAFALFKMRNDLVHPRYVNVTKRRDSEIPDVFRKVCDAWPPARCRQVAEATVNALLQDTGSQDLREEWLERGYSGPPR